MAQAWGVHTGRSPFEPLARLMQAHSSQRAPGPGRHLSQAGGSGPADPLRLAGMRVAWAQEAELPPATPGAPGVDQVLVASLLTPAPRARSGISSFWHAGCGHPSADGEFTPAVTCHRPSAGAGPPVLGTE